MANLAQAFTKMIEDSKRNGSWGKWCEEVTNSYAWTEQFERDFERECKKLQPRLPEGFAEYRNAKYGERDLTLSELVNSFQEFTSEGGPW